MATNSTTSLLQIGLPLPIPIWVTMFTAAVILCDWVAHVAPVEVDDALLTRLSYVLMGVCTLLGLYLLTGTSSYYHSSNRKGLKTLPKFPGEKGDVEKVVENHCPRKNPFRKACCLMKGYDR